jgi:hypothetical protein
MPTTTTTATPTLQSPPIVNADGSIDLVFNTAMAAGSGTIIITDGAIQTVIDRATGLPTMRVVGANDTHTVSASSVGIEGTHVKLNVPGLLPGHEYSIVMASGVLVSSGHVAFGGIRSTSQAPFTVPSGGDTKGPSATIELDGNELLNGGSIGLTITLTDKITDAAVMANLLSTPNAAIVAGSLSSADGGLTWKASLQPGGSVVAPVNAVTLDLSSIRDANGHAGSIVKSGNYQVDPTVAAFVEHEIGIIDWYGPSEDDRVSNISDQSFHGTLSAALQEHQHLMLSIDGGDEFEGWTDGTTWGDSEDGMRFEDGTYSVTARVVDDAHHASASFTQHFTIDTVAPIMLSSPNGASGNTGTDFVFTFNEAMYLIEGEGYSRLRIEDNEGKVGWIDILPEWLSADRKTLKVPAAQLGLQEGRDYTFTLSSDITDLAGNEIADRSNMHFHTTGADTLAPHALEAHTVSPAGMYGIGQKIEIAVSFDEAVQPAGSGTPTLRLDNGGLALWDRSSADGRTMIFKYIVGANGENDTYDRNPIKLADNTDLANHVSDLAGNLLDQAHINYSTLDIPYEDGYGHHDSGGLIQVDAHAPPAPGTPELANDTGVAGDGITNDPIISGSGTASFAHIKLFDNGTLIGTTDSDTYGKWTIGASALSDGTHTLTARQFDGFGNESPLSGALTFTLDTAAPAAMSKAVLDTASDSGIYNNDGITNVKTPKLKGLALEAGGTVEIYDGATLIGTAAVQSDKTWSYTVGSQPERLAQFADGVHGLTVKQVDAAGNRSAASDSLSVTVDTAGPSLMSNQLDWNSDKHRFELKFSEKIVFATNGAIDVLNDLNVLYSHHVGSLNSNWEIGDDGHGEANVLELNLGGLIGLFGHFHLKADTSAIQDLAGNVAVIGTPDFNLLPF